MADITRETASPSYQLPVTVTTAVIFIDSN